MSFAFDIKLARRFGRAAGSQGFASVVNWFSVAGVMIGVAALVVVMAVMDGFQTQIVARILELNGHMSIYLPPSRRLAYGELAQSLEAQPETQSLTLYLDKETLATHDRRAAGVLMRGLAPQDLAAKPLITRALQGSTALEGNQVVIGHRLAADLGLELGDSFHLLLTQQDSEGRQIEPLRHGVVVGGIFNAGFLRFDEGVIYVSLSFARQILELPGGISSIELTATSVQDIGPLARRIQYQLAPDTNVQDWAQANADFMQVVETQKRLLFLVLLIIVVVAAFNIVAGQVMLVVDKARQIAILRTMGGSQGSMMRIFVYLGAGLGLIGTGLGLALGLLLAANLERIRKLIETSFGIRLFPQDIYFLAELPTEISPPVLLVIALASLSLCLLAALYPAWRAAKTDPAEVLRRA